MFFQQKGKQILKLEEKGKRVDKKPKIEYFIKIIKYYYHHGRHRYRKDS